MPKPNTTTPPEKVRLNLELSRPVHEQMQALQKRSDASSLTEVIRRALALYDVVTEHLSGGGQVVLRREDGEEEKLRIL